MVCSFEWHPQLTVLPDLKLLAQTFLVAPQEQRHSQTALLALVLPTNLKTSRRP
jgi:hypothetical protein